jgi:ribulose-phosphate 3-epimerase
MREDVQIAPSILSADFLNLGSELESVSNADFVHYDVMDGHYVSNISFGPGILRAVKRGTELPVDVHLMVTNPDETCRDYLEAGADLVTFHMEAARHPRRIVDEIHEFGRLAGVAINPGTPVSALESMVDCVDMVLIMSVNPGFSGQRFIDHTFDQLRALEKLFSRTRKHPLVEIDGGISAANAEQVVSAGARVLVGGSAVFDAPDHARAVEEMRTAGRRGLSRWA